MSILGRKYGYKKSLPDHRDLGIARLSAPPVLPPSVDLEPWCGPVKDQGQLGACTAFSGCGNREYLARKFENKSPVLSPLFLYYIERQIEGTLGQDAGAHGRTDCQAMNKFGICEESEDSYNIANYNNPPTQEQLAAALQWKAGAYHSLATVDDMKACLASDYPVLIGFAVYESFEHIGSGGAMPMPKDSEQLLGGHEVLVIGYNDELNAFKVRNSWGSDWGDHGNFWMPYDVAAKLIWDRFIQHLGPSWK